MLAIVIPYYKLTFFETTLQSLVNQSNKKFKVYIGDDASPENPAGLLENYQAKFDFYYHRFEDNLGGSSLVKQWERCLALTNNESWVLILGDDDVLDNNCVAAFYENLKEIETLKINVIRFATKVINSEGEPISKVHMHPKLENSIDFLKRKFKGGTRSSLSEYIFRKQIVEVIKFKDLPLAWFSDLLAVLEFSKFGLIYSINEAIVYFRLSELNITGKQDDLLLKNIATFNFYYYLLNKKSTYFDISQINILYNSLEKCFLDNKKKLNYWMKLTRIYFVRFELKRYLNFLIKVYKSVKRR